MLVWRSSTAGESAGSECGDAATSDDTRQSTADNQPHHREQTSTSGSSSHRLQHSHHATDLTMTSPTAAVGGSAYPVCGAPPGGDNSLLQSMQAAAAASMYTRGFYATGFTHGGYGRFGYD